MKLHLRRLRCRAATNTRAMALSEGVRSNGSMRPVTHLAMRLTDLAFLASICIPGWGLEQA